MSDELLIALDRGAAEIRAEGHNGWGNTMDEAAARIRALEEKVSVLSADRAAIRQEYESDLAAARADAELSFKRTAILASTLGAITLTSSYSEAKKFAHDALDQCAALSPTVSEGAGDGVCHCTCHNDPLYCRNCTECKCHEGVK